MSENKRIPGTYILSLIIFLSGFSALILQIVWIRDFSLLFGTHLLSTSTVLTVFMAGLSVGALVFGKLSDRVLNPALLLLLIQGGIAVFALAFHPLYEGVTTIYGEINRSGGWLSGYPDLTRFILSALVLILPATLMGGTLPVIIRLYTGNLEQIGKKVGSLYALNNAGALGGGLLAGFFLVRILGSSGTEFIAAGINTINVILIVMFFPVLRAGEPIYFRNEKASPGEPGSGAVGKVLAAVLAVTAIEGFTMMVYEILWTRTMLEFSYDKSAYVYTVVILGTLTGLSAGSILSGKRIDAWKNLVLKFSLVEYLAGVAAWAVFLGFSFLAPHIFNARLGNASWIRVSGQEYIVFFIITAIPAFFMGISYPLAGRIINRIAGRLGTRMGLLSFTDTAGSVAGPAVAGFIMLRYLDIYTSFLLCVLLNLGSALILVRIDKIITAGKKLTLSMVVPVTILLVVILFPRSAYYMNKTALYPGERIVDIREGISATVAVTELPSKYMALSINGAKTAFTNPEDQRVHKMLAYLPWFFNPTARDAAVIGYGLGITTRCLAELGIHTDVAELSPEVLSLSAEHFGYLNHGLIANGNTKVFVEDGRSMLQRSTKKYDIITTNAVHPRLGPNLYSEDFYRLCSQRLTDSGTICQWIPTNWMSAGEFRSLIHAFTNVFPNPELWYVNRSHMLLTGSRVNPEISYSRFRELFYRPEIFNELTEVDLREVNDILAGFFTGGEKLRQWASASSPDTDDKPVIGYSFVTDPRPNLEILGWIINERADFEKRITFPDTMPAGEKDNVLQRVNFIHREHIGYLRNLRSYLAGEDSLKK